MLANAKNLYIMGQERSHVEREDITFVLLSTMERIEARAQNEVSMRHRSLDTQLDPADA
ncbi:MAG: hypothetical protein IBJ19_09600 [Gemmatimonadaceae bacterium]|nr:hypothetical protein [Gemmatimonadaceae bacterium]